VAALPACSSAFDQSRFNSGLISVDTKLLVKFPCYVHLMSGIGMQAFVFRNCFQSFLVISHAFLRIKVSTFPPLAHVYLFEKT
jgi:hypothetical protein